MTSDSLRRRLAAICDEELPLPGKGSTAQRHARLMQVGREDLSLARLAEAHWDAVAILAEAGRTGSRGCLYGVWASEIPDRGLQLRPVANGYVISGTKLFCSGADIVGRALVTVASPEPYLVELDVEHLREHTLVDVGSWKTDAFRTTRTGTVSFDDFPVHADAIIAFLARSMWTGRVLGRGRCGASRLRSTQPKKG
jgi:alkylation response protein AidB-like acyl-CoA dehydrogenase